MTDRRLDVLAIGNAIVDVIANADDAFLEAEAMHKGAMRLIDETEATGSTQPWGRPASLAADRRRTRSPGLHRSV